MSVDHAVFYRSVRILGHVHTIPDRLSERFETISDRLSVHT